MSLVELIEGNHCYDGKCMPGNEEEGNRTGGETFSVGIFAWKKRAKGKGLTRGIVKVRVRGDRDNPQKVYYKAMEIIELLDNEGYEGPKTVRV